MLRIVDISLCYVIPASSTSRRKNTTYRMSSWGSGDLQLFWWDYKWQLVSKTCLCLWLANETRKSSENIERLTAKDYCFSSLVRDELKYKLHRCAYTISYRRLCLLHKETHAVLLHTVHRASTSKVMNYAVKPVFSLRWILLVHAWDILWQNIIPSLVYDKI